MSAGSSEHAASLRQAIAALNELRLERDALQKAQSEPIAIIGVGCRFPGGANSPQAFWQLLHDGVDAVGEIPASRWPRSMPPPTGAGTRWAGLLENVDLFDAAFFQISPREAVGLDPQQRLLLEVGWEALEDAGQVPEQLVGSRTGVFIGAMHLDYRDWASAAYPAWPDPYSATGCTLSGTAGRLSYVLGLQGPCAAVDGACASSLVAIHLACQSLRSGESTLALAGGVNLILSPLTMDMAARAQAISPDGRCKTFDASANGVVRAEGCGILVLKRLSAAQRDGDPIWAVIRGSAINQDGRSAGFTAPNVLSQQNLLHKALAMARVLPSQVSYVEAHGTGTSLGDPIEVAALTTVFGQPRSDGSACVISSVKTNIGHSESAAGVAGVIKTLLALRHQLIPRHLHFKAQNPRFSLAGTPLVIPVDARPWPSGGAPRIAGVSSFGLTGINAHAILEEAPAPALRPPEPARAQLLTLSAKTAPALRALVERFYAFLAPPAAAAAASAAAAAGAAAVTDTSDATALADIAYTASVRRGHHAHRLPIVGTTRSEWRAALATFLQDKTPAGLGPTRPEQPPKLVFVFSGHGSQWAGMGRQLLNEEPVFRAAFTACDAAVQRETGSSPLAALLSDKDRRWLDSPSRVQPILFALQVALAALWRSWGVVPDAIVGTSMGEIAAAHVCGALGLDDAVRVICRRSELISQLGSRLAGRGAMAVVELSTTQAAALTRKFPGQLAIAACNGPKLTVLSGDAEAIAIVLKQLDDAGIFSRRLPGSVVASHSAYMDVLHDELLSALAELKPGAPTIPMYSTVTQAEVAPGSLDAAYWFRNLREPVLLWPTVETLRASGHELFVELSPHPVVLPALQDGFAQTADRGVALGSLRREQDERRVLLETLGELYGRGIAISWPRLYATPRVCVTLPTYPWQHERYWVEEQAPSGKGRLRRTVPSVTAVHPLLGERSSLATQPGTHFWENELSIAALPYLAEHRVEAAVVFPGTAYLEMALAAARQVRGDGRITLEAVQLERMLTLAKHGARALQTVLTVRDAQHADLYIASQEEGKWVRHATATVRWETRAAAALPTLPPLAAVQQRCATYRSKAQHYQRMQQLQGDYGPAFQGVQELWADPWEVLAQVTVTPPVAEQLAEYMLHPAWLDACLHAALGALGITGNEAVVPVSIGRLEVWRTVSDPVWVHVTLQPDGDQLVLDFVVRTAAAEPVLHAQGVRAQRLAVGARVKKKLQESWLYELQWQKRAAEPPAATEPGQKDWLVFADRGETSAAVLAILRERGVRCVAVTAGGAYRRLGPGRYQIDPTDAQSYRTLLHEAFGKGSSCRGVVHLWSLDTSSAAPPTPQQLAQDQDLSCRSALYLVQALGRSGWPAPPRLWLVTRGSRAVTAFDTVVHAAQAPLWGLGQAVVLEHPELLCTRIDLSATLNASEGAALARELQSETREEQVALRGPERYVARLVQGAFRDTEFRAQALCRSDATYLISGGLSGIGLTTAQWLVEQGARYLVLVGRSAARAAAQEAVAMLRSAGVHVMTAQVDISQYAEVAALLAALEHQLPPLRGIVHSAAVADDGILLEQSWERFARVLAPKMHGAWNLHLLTQSAPLDFFIGYSSAASLLGVLGQSSYVAANAFIDALAAQRKCSGRCGLSINWGLFSEVGMATHRPGVSERFLIRGGDSMTPAEAQPILVRLLAAAPAQVGVIKLDAQLWIAAHAGLAASPYWSALARDADPSSGKVVHAQWLKVLAAVPAAERQALLEQLLAAQLGRTLRLAVARIDPQTRFLELGLDSLSAVELRNRLDAELHLTVPIPVLLKDASIVRLAAYLLERLAVAAPAAAGS